MDDNKKDLLNENRQKIVESIDIHDTLLGLRKYLVFDSSDQQKVCNPALYPTDIQKSGELVDIVLRRGNRGFWAFSHSLKRKSPNVFDLLHDPKLVDASNCFVCREKEEEIKCQNCLGLMNCIAHPKIKKPIDLADVFDELKLKNNVLLEQIKKTEKEYYDLSSEYHSAKERYQQNNYNHQKYLEEKQKQLQDLLKEKRDVIVEKEIIEGDLKRMKKKVQSLEQEKKSLNEEIKSFGATIDEEFYQNQAVLYGMRIQKKDTEIQELTQKNKKLSERNLKLLENSNISEKLLERTKDEYKYRIESLEKQNLEQADDIAKKNAELSYLRYANEQKSSQMDKSQKDVEDLLVKLQESNKLNKSLQHDSKIAHILSKNDFEAVNEITRLHQKNEDFFQRINELELSLRKNQSNFLTSMNKYSGQVKDLQKENILFKDENINLERIKQELEEKVMELNDELAMILDHQSTSQNTKKALRKIEDSHEMSSENQLIEQLRDTDKNVFIQPINDKCGVTIGLKKGRVYVGESNTVIKDWKDQHMVEPKGDIRKGDFLMAVQGIDVTGWDCIKVKEFLQSQKGRVHLVLRSPVLRSKQTMNITIEKCEVKHFEELGLSLHLIVKVKPGSQAEQFGFNEFDEVTQVGKKDVKTLSLSDVRAKLKEMIKQKPGSVMIERYNDILVQGRRESVATEMSFSDTSSIGSRQPSLLSSSYFLPSFEDFTGPTEPVEHEMLPSHNPPLPPRNKKASSIERSSSSNSGRSSSNNLTFGERNQDQPDGYSSVTTYNRERSTVQPNLQKQSSTNSSKTIAISLIRQPEQGYGFEILGGNKIGIYIKSVMRWTPAEKHGIQCGWKLISIEGLNLEKAALGYAVEVLKKYGDYGVLEFVFEESSISESKFEEMSYHNQHDQFEIQSRIDYKAKSENELSFHVGEKLVVVNSCAKIDTDEGYMWVAKKLGADGELVQGLIPKQSATRASNIREHTYEEMGLAAPPKICQLYDASVPKPDMIYKIVTPADDVTI